MRAAAFPLWVVLVVTMITAGRAQEPAPPEPAPTPTADTALPPPPAPAVEAAAPAFAGLMDPGSYSGFRRPEQSPYGTLFPPSPAQDVAMLEAGRPVFATDPLVAATARLLERLTAAYVEDAPRIAKLTIRAVQQVRAANQPATPLEVLDGAIRWQGPGGPRGSVPRKFEQFAALYRTGRIGGKDHAATLAQMQPPAPVPSPAGTPSP